MSWHIVVLGRRLFVSLIILWMFWDIIQCMQTVMNNRSLILLIVGLLPCRRHLPYHLPLPVLDRLTFIWIWSLYINHWHSNFDISHAVVTERGLSSWQLSLSLISVHYSSDFTSPPDRSRWSLFLALSAASGRSVTWLFRFSLQYKLPYYEVLSQMIWLSVLLCF